MYLVISSHDHEVFKVSYYDLSKSDVHYAMFGLQKSKWVWSGKTTVKNRRQTHGTAKKSHTTIKSHREDIQAKQ